MKHFLTTLLLFTTFGLIAQEVNISGKVTDDQGEALIGATVQTKGTTIGTITDVDGVFSLSVPEETTTLVVSYTGYKDLEVSIGGRTTIDIVLAEGLTLDEVIVVGYGTQKKSDLTGAIGSLSGEDLDKIQIGDPSQLLLGRMSGVRVESVGGSPGASTNIVVRGVSSLTDSNPLFVIDGMFTDNMDFLNPSDIKSIQVLKDASAAAIYGSRAANGVIIITTNDGKGVQGTTVDFEASIGNQSQIRELDWLTGAEYAQLRNQLAIANAPEGQEPNFLPGFNEELDPSANTIIDDIAISDAMVTNMSLRVAGGAKDVSYNISANWLDQEGIIVASDFDRKTFRANIAIDKGKFKFSENLAFTSTYRTKNTIWNLGNNILPTIPFRNPDNDGGFGGATLDTHGNDGNNHIGRALLQDRHETKENLLGNLNASYELLEGLTVNANLGLQYFVASDYTFNPTFFISENINANRVDAELIDRTTKYVNLLGEGTINYKKSFARNSMELLAGFTTQKTSTNRGLIWVSGFPSNDIRQASAASNLVQTGGTEVVSTLNSIFGRVNYNFGEKYFLTATIRRDGSSRFLKENRYGVFPSIGAAWTISNEGFLASNPSVSNLKLRASYGELGSQNIGDYAFIPVLNINSDAVIGNGQNRIPGVSQTVFANPNLVWETTKTYNIGLDIALFDYKFTLTADYFDKVSEDILVDLRIPPSSGTNVSVAQNAASIQNTGLELAASYNDKVGALDFSIGANLTFLNNEVLELGENIAPIAAGPNSTSTVTLTDVGGQVAAYYGYVVTGIYRDQAVLDADLTAGLADANAQLGDFQYEDVDGNGILDLQDQTFLGSYMPEYEYGFVVNANYKNFDLNMIFNGVAGNEIWNNTKGANLLQLNSNMLREALDYWTPENPDASLPRIGGGANNARSSSFYVEDGSYFRLRNIQIGYTLPSSVMNKINLRKVRIYASAQNLFTITNYSGYYPEIGRSRDDEDRVVDNNNVLFFAGVDQSAYPTPRTIITGIQIGF